MQKTGLRVPGTIQIAQLLLIEMGRFGEVRLETALIGRYISYCCFSNGECRVIDDVADQSCF